MKHTLCLTAALCAFTGLACAQDTKPKADAKPAESKAAPAEKTTDVVLGDLTFKVPATWEAKKQPRMFSKAGFTIPEKQKGAGMEADLYHFPGENGGGDIPSNIARWQGQFKRGEDGSPPEAKKEEVAFGDKKALFVTLKGTFMAGSAATQERTPKEGYTMSGIIIETADGKVILKFTGPDAAMTALQPEIKKLVASAFPAAK